jgi:hypothetical protein
MGRSHKTVILECLQLCKELGLKIEFDNVVNGEFIKPYATSVIIDDKRMQAIKGLQAWDNTDFRMYFMPCLIEYAKHGNIKELAPCPDTTKSVIEHIADYVKGSKTSSTKDKSGHVEYAKDSYHWSKIDLLDKWHEFAELSMDSDYDNALDIPLDDYKANLKKFLLNAMKKTIACNPKMNEWSAERLEETYITHSILPKFIKNELKLILNNEQLREVQETYLLHNPELFNDCLHRLTNDTMVKDDLLFKMGLV